MSGGLVGVPTKAAGTRERDVSRHDQRRKDEDFDQRLQRLRLKIDLLPPQQRPHLYELADAVAEHHRRSQSRKSRSHDAQ